MKLASSAFLLAVLAASPRLYAQGDRHGAAPPAYGESPRTLVLRANAAFRDGAFVAPAGANALEYLLAARALDPADRSVEVALLELFPVALSAADAQVAAGNRTEAARIVGLIDRAVPNSSSVAELRRQLELPRASQVVLVPGQ